MAVSLITQLAAVAQAPTDAALEGLTVQRLCGDGCLPRGGWPLAGWSFGQGLARSWHGQLSPGPGALEPVAPVGVMPTPEHMPNTGYIIPLPEQRTGRIVAAQG